MEVDNKLVTLYTVTITNQEHAEIFDEPVYKREGMAIDLLRDIGIFPDEIITSTVNRDTVYLKFYTVGAKR